MKSEIVQICEKESSKLPRLMEFNNEEGIAILLVNGETPSSLEGTVVYSTNKYLNVGCTSNSWVKKGLIPFDGKVILSN
jgi:hypothetical protein